MTGPITPEAIAGFDAAMIEILRRRHPHLRWRAIGPPESEGDTSTSAGDTSPSDDA